MDFVWAPTLVPTKTTDAGSARFAQTRSGLSPEAYDPAPRSQSRTPTDFFIHSSPTTATPGTPRP